MSLRYIFVLELTLTVNAGNKFILLHVVFMLSTFSLDSFNPDQYLITINAYIQGETTPYRILLHIPIRK